MLTKTITYTDFNGAERKETFYFNLKEDELTMMNLSVDGGLGAKLQKLAEKKNIPEMIKIFKELILSSYGEVSPDGKQFLKRRTEVTANGVAYQVNLADEFEQTNAYSALFHEIISDADAAAAFVAGIVPPEVAAKMREEMDKKAVTE